jgi:DNA-directed RNA polymerase subunit RPC12/RpoP
MTVYLTCKKCGYKFGASTIEYMAEVVDCPRCGVPRADLYCPHISPDEVFKNDRGII